MTLPHWLAGLLRVDCQCGVCWMAAHPGESYPPMPRPIPPPPTGVTYQCPSCRCTVGFTPPPTAPRFEARCPMCRVILHP